MITEAIEGRTILPTGWTWVQLQDLVLQPKGDIVDGPFGSNLKASEYLDEGVPIIRLQNIARNSFLRKNIKFISGAKAQELKRHNFASGDIVITKLGDPLGKACLVPNDIPYGILVADVVRVRVSENNVSKKFLLYAINSEGSIKQFRQKTKGTTRPRVNLNHVRELNLPIAPLNEQQRIVGKVEELFSFLDAGVASLRAVQAQLKRYRQAVLKAAFEGKLTEQWLKNNKAAVEPIKNVLETIRNEKLSGKFNRRKNLISIDLSRLPDLPEHWVWTTFNDLAENSLYSIKAGPFGSALKKEFYKHKGFKIYGQEQVLRGDPFFGDYYISKELFEDLKSCAVKSGDILISLVGTIGKVLILPEGIEEGIINPRLVKFSLDKRAIDPNYIKFYFLSSTTKHYFSISSHGGTMDILNLTILKSLPIALPSLAEQRIIIQELERAFSLAAEAEKSLKNNLLRAERLRQSVLKTAFIGRLVPQNSKDEPAEKLLKRIKAERSSIKSKNSQLELSEYVK